MQRIHTKQMIKVKCRTCRQDKATRRARLLALKIPAPKGYLPK